MLRIEPKAEYADVMERALYNCALAGMALDGKHFFYVNPLEVNPLKSLKDPTKSHVKPVRPSWLGCACCPPNLARLITSIDDYIYTENTDFILINQFIAGQTEFSGEDGVISITQATDYPWDDSAELAIGNSRDNDINIGVRIPAWADGYQLSVDGTADTKAPEDGYVYITVKGNTTAKISLKLDVSIKRYYANTAVSNDIGKVTIARGPFIYCIEGVDNGDNLNSIFLPADAKFEYEWDSKLLNGVGIIKTTGLKLVSNNNTLYNTQKPKEEQVQLKFIPYYAWANRGENEMLVWLHESY